MYVRTVPEPNERVEGLSPIALALFDLGKADEAKKIVEELKPLALKLSPEEDAGELRQKRARRSAFSIFQPDCGLSRVFRIMTAAWNRYS